MLRWHLAVDDALYLARLALAGALAVVLDRALSRVEEWIDAA